MNPLSTTAHRPWPVPTGSWIMAQRWCDLLFAHWPVAPDLLRTLVPKPFELDLFEGRAWVGVVPFRMQGVRFRGLPPAPGLGAFPELNVRTYVSYRGRPGVWFFSLDAARRLAVQVARAWFHLPYFFASMECSRLPGERVPGALSFSEKGQREPVAGPSLQEDGIRYSSRRTQPGSPPARFAARYGPVGPVSLARPETLDHWLTERYCLYALRPDGGVLQGDVHHAPWPLQPARAEFEHEEVSRAAGFELEGAPLLHFARSLDVVVWRPRLMR